MIFGRIAQLRKDFMNAKFLGTTRDDFFQVRDSASSIIRDINADASRIHENGPSVHGTVQHGQLDLLDQWRLTACNIMDQCETMGMKIIT